MFEHGGFRPLWPVIFFLPFLLVGAAYLLESARHGRAWMALTHLSFGPHPSLRPIALGLSLLLLAAAPVALADAPLAEHCPVPPSAPQQARWLADALFEQGAYQRAGECYEAAGEHALADEAFVKAVGPRSSTTTRQLSEQRDQAKALLHQLQQAFRAGR